MAYNNFGQYIHTRVPSEAQDPYRVSAEQFVKNVETYLYDTASPFFRDPNFLAWNVSAFDQAKQGSGRPLDAAKYIPGVNNVPGVLNPPIQHPVKDGYEYRVEYSRADWIAGKVPNNYDGTAPYVEEHAVYQVVLPPHGVNLVDNKNKKEDDA